MPATVTVYRGHRRTLFFLPGIDICVALFITELHAGPNFKIRPDPAHENRDPTRPDPMTIHDGQKKALLLHLSLIHI